MSWSSAVLLEHNLAALGQVFADLGPTIRSTELPPNAELRGPEDSPGLRIDGKTLHSLRDPIREAARIVAASPAARTYVLCGLGLGYLAQAFLDAPSRPRVVVVEPDPRLLRLCCEARDCSAMFQPDRFALILDRDPALVTGVLAAWGAESVHVIRAGTAALQAPVVWEALEQAIRHYGQRRSVNTNTIERFGARWVRNLLRNVARGDWSTGINALRGQAGGIPALVLGAGPGLNEVLPRLAELRKRMIVVAVDTARGLCLRHGVRPDISVVVDPQYWNSRHLDFSPYSDEPVVCELATSPRALRMLPGLHRFAASLFPLGKWVESGLKPRDALGAGGSVATTAWDLARLLGCDPIVLAGVDLGFPDLQTHARGALFEQRAHWRSHRLEPTETAMSAYLFSGEPYLTKSQSGGTVLSDRRMMVYRSWFSEQIPDSRRRVLRLGDGASIPGCQSTSIADLLKLPEHAQRPNLSGSATPDPLDPADLLMRMEAGFSEVSSLANLAAGLCRRLLAKAATVAVSAAEAGPKSADDPDAEAARAELDRVDARLQSHPLIRAAGFLLHRQAAELLDAEPPADMTAALHRSLNLYLAIGHSSTVQAEWARQERLKCGSPDTDAPIDRVN